MYYCSVAWQLLDFLCIEATLRAGMKCEFMFKFSLQQGRMNADSLSIQHLYRLWTLIFLGDSVPWQTELQSENEVCGESIKM